MNLILELPDTTEKASIWAIACQIRDLNQISSVVCVENDALSNCPGFEEIWIESEVLASHELGLQATIRQLSMIVRDWVASGARLRLQGDVIIEI